MSEPGWEAILELIGLLMGGPSTGKYSPRDTPKVYECSAACREARAARA
jgi:hypothetical protein